MTHAEIKQARHRLGLTTRQLAEMLDTDPQSVRRMELPPDRSTSRPAPPRVARLVRAYLAGYRPDDWPAPR